MKRIAAESFLHQFLRKTGEVCLYRISTRYNPLLHRYKTKRLGADPAVGPSTLPFPLPLRRQKFEHWLQ